MNKEGWANVAELIEKTVDFNLSKEFIDVVETNEKQRFKLSDDKLKIRSNQGHTIDVDLNLCAKQPPHFLLHGTAERFMGTIENEGLCKQKKASNSLV